MIDYQRFEKHYDVQYLALSVPDEFGTNRLWQIDNRVDLDRYSIGSEVQATAHDGFLGVPWCDIHDRTFTVFGELGKLQKIRGRKGGHRTFAHSAHGRFSPDSPYRPMIESWGIPVNATVD